MSKLIFEHSQKGKSSNIIKTTKAPIKSLPKELVRQEPIGLPEIAEIDVVRHYTQLSTLNFGVDSGFYPLGSCTMKYNPKINEDMSALSEFANVHPLQDESTIQGILELLYNMQQHLNSIFGYDAFTLQPVAGAHGELTGLLIIKKYFESKSESFRNIILIPDSAHGTNPASATSVGYRTKSIPSGPRGGVDIEALKKVVSSTPNLAGLMLTNPNTLGLFDENIIEIAAIIHQAGGLLYYDGANANATLGITKPAELGFDVAHINLHKTFATPHGGGGPGSGPVGVTKELAPFLPGPMITKTANGYTFNNPAQSIGKVHSFYGNVGVVIKAYAYIVTLGSQGLREVSENAIINANYMMERLKPYYTIPFGFRTCKHEFVISMSKEKKEHGVRALDVAKRLIDYGFHPPTIYFPLIVSECLMIEPTETESRESLDTFCDAMIAISKEIRETPELLLEAPHNTPVKRLDEAKAVKEPKLTFASFCK